MFTFQGCALASVLVTIFGQRRISKSSGTVPSVGVASTLWKLLQISGRLGRGAGESAIFITVAPKKHTMRGRPFECGVIMIFYRQTLSLTYREGWGQTCQGIVCLRHLHQQGSLWPIWNPESGRWENSVTLVTLGHVSALCCIYWRQIIQPHYSNHSQPLPSRSVNKQQADSREPGGKQIQDTGDLFFIYTSLTSYALQVLFRSMQTWTSTPPRQGIVVLLLAASSGCH